MKSPIVTVSIHRATGQDRVADRDLVAVEEPLQIRLAKRDLAITMRTPGHDRELAAGFLFTEGILQSPTQIASVEADDRGTVTVHPKAGVEAGTESRNFYVTSSCGVCGKASIESLHAAGCNSLTNSLPNIESSVILSLPEKLRSAQQVFEHTGGLHAAALFRADGELVEVREDVGRHNAVDKLIGSAFLAGRLDRKSTRLNSSHT